MASFAAFSPDFSDTGALAALSPNFDPYAAHSDTGALFGKLGRSISRASKSIVKTAVKPLVQKALPLVTTALKNMGPIGMVASGGIAAMQAGLSGKGLEAIAWAAAKGAAPSGIDAAIGAAQQLRHGKIGGVVNVALSQATKSFVPGTAADFGFKTAISVLKNAPNKAALGVARRALPDLAAKKAFDSAIGVAAEAAKKVPSAKPRPYGIANIVLKARGNPISVMSPGLSGAVAAIKRNPGLATLDPMVSAQRLGVSVATVNDAIRKAAKPNLLPWRALSVPAAKFVIKYAPNASRLSLRRASDTAGLDQTGTKYVVEKGDYPVKIAQKLTGNQNRYRELIQANPQKKLATSGQFKGSFATLNAGEILNLPASWQRPISEPVRTAPPTSVSTPSVKAEAGAPTDISASVLQGKAILAAWGQTDGANQAGVSDYGGQILDMSTTIGPRDALQIQSFQNWYNNQASNSKISQTGSLDASTLAALQSWAEKRANAATVVVFGTDVIKSAGQPTGSTASNTNPSNPVSVVVKETPAGTTVTPNITPSTTPGAEASASGATVKVAPSSSKQTSLMPIAMGAIGGALLAGPVGAIIGAAGGAAIS